jgi:DNA-binding GntR family transcriptional regulator
MTSVQSETQKIVSVAAPLRKQVTEALREAIVSMEFASGQRLVERDLCERFGVSRTVVREALRHLEAEGLVELVPNHGPVVSTMTPSDARDLYEVRESLESLVAQRCAERATSEQKVALAAALEDVRAAYQTGDLGDELKAKDQFYEALYAGAGNPMIAALLRGIQARAQMLRGYSLQTPGRVERSLDELEQIVGAIQAGNAALARKIAATHVRNAGDAALARLEELEATA